ncbi:hypothetical protein GCM10011316_00240 [Roseibium aquae]|uniref:Uncharacterized protein n=1 Tax=Roseibium aquae TaxID=1323746 RepID=A0A916WTU8_9HYPH|nr:hypothetical protein GCM10011316_00240 [Roseibium aquae]
MGHKLLSPLEAALDLAFDIARTILAPFRIHAKKIRKMGAPVSETGWKIQHFPKAAVPRDEFQIRVEY